MITTEENANGIDILIADMVKSPELKNVFATLQAAGGKTPRTSV